MAFSPPPLDSAIWATTFICEGVALYALRLPQRFASTRALKLYLAFQMAALAIMVPVYAFAPEWGMYWAYLGITLLGYGAELNLLIGVFLDIRGRTKVWGSLQSWIAATLALSFLVLILGQHDSSHSPWCLALIASMRHVSGIVRMTALVTVSVYGYMMASSWPLSTRFVWLGAALYVLPDFVFAELSLYHPFWESCLRHVPDFAFFASLTLWSVRSSSPACAQRLLPPLEQVVMDVGVEAK